MDAISHMVFVDFYEDERGILFPYTLVTLDDDVMSQYHVVYGNEYKMVKVSETGNNPLIPNWQYYWHDPQRVTVELPDLPAELPDYVCLEKLPELREIWQKARMV